MQESFDGYREVFFYQKFNIFKNFFEKAKLRVAISKSTLELIATLPKFFIELIGFAILISLIIVYSYLESFDKAILLLSVFGVALIKLVPSFQALYHNFTNIFACYPSFKKILPDLVIEEKPLDDKEEKYKINFKFTDNDYMRLENLSFKFKKENLFSLSDINVKIPLENSIVGISGPSGSGKTTLVNILMTLITPDSGKIYFNNQPIETKNYIEWRKNISFVPQFPFIMNENFYKNIAFELDESLIDKKLVEKCIELTSLNEMVNELPLGLNTVLNQKGSNISGGQSQRIAISRALYKKSKLIFFDEITSALDKNTEQEIFKKIFKSIRATTFIISHKSSTLDYCDYMLLMNKGRIDSFKRVIKNKSL